MNSSKLPRKTNNFAMNRTFQMKYKIQKYNGKHMKLTIMKYFRMDDETHSKSHNSHKKNTESYMK